MARVEGGSVVIDTDWPGLKNQIDSRNINFKYEEDSTAYQIFAIDGQYFYQTIIYKSGQAPQNQATYDTWRTEFETSYKNRTTDFTSTQPFYLTTIDGYSVILKDGSAPTANDGYGIAIIGYDGTNYRMSRMDSSGRQILVGAGVAGTPAGGVISIQGVSGGQAMPVSGSVTVSGTVTATNPSVGSNDTTLPTSSTLIGGSDGTNLRAARLFDLDSGGGTQYVIGVGLRKAAGGGSVELGTSSDPIRTDPTGTTIQPISGTVTSNIGTTGGLALDTSVNGILRAQGSTTSGQTGPLIQGAVTTAAPLYTNAQTSPLSLTTSGLLRIDGSGVTQPVSGTVTANAGTGNFTVIQSAASNLRAQTSSESNTGSAIPTQASMVGGSDGTNLRSIFVDSSGRQFVVGAAANGAAVAGNPVLVGGSDGTNARSIRTATDGTIRIDPTGTTTQPVSGTVAATQSGAWTVTANAGTGNFSVIGTATDNTANSTTKLPVMAARANTAAPSWSDGNMVPLSVDTAGALRISGTINAANPSVSTNNAAIPTSSTQIGGSDGTNLQALRVFDGDTGGGTQYILGVGLRKFASGGTVELGTSTDPIRIDPTGTTTQPVSGTVTANQGGAPWSQNITQFGGVAISTGTGASGIGIPRITVANDSNILATQSGTWTVQQGTPPWSVVGPGATGAALSGNPVRIAGSDGTNTRNITTDTSGRLLVSGAAADGAAVAGNPILIAGQDGTNVQSIATDGYGRIQVQISGGTSTTQVEGRAADGAATVGNPVYIGGTDGSNIQAILTDSLGRIITAPAGSATSNGFSFGDVALSAVTTSVVRRTTYNEQTTNATRSIASANVNDTSAGTGARQVRITYYDASGNGPFTTTVTLNGTTAVATSVSDICFIEEMEVISVGSGGQNAGIITLFVNNAGGGGTIGTIAAGDNRTYWAHHYVPNGKTCNITSLSVVVNGGSALFFVRAKTIGVSTAVNIQVSDYVRSAVQSGTNTRSYGTPIKITGPATLLMYVSTEANTALTYRGAFDFYDE